MNAIAAVDKNFAIGSKGELLIYIPEDLKRFKRLTEGKVVIYGRKTLATFPGGRPLKNRTNIVLSANPDFDCEGAIVCRSLQELLERLKEFDQEDVFCIGGERVYALLLPYYKKIYLTHIDHEFPEADAFFPGLSEDWQLTEESEVFSHDGMEYCFRDYERSLFS